MPPAPGTAGPPARPDTHPYTRHPHLINTGYEWPTQRRYHVPPDWLRRGRNTLVLLEEQVARPGKVRIVRRAIGQE